MKKYGVFAFAVFAIIGLVGFSGVSQADLDDGLIAYYPFNGDASDESGSGYDGTVNGAMLTADRFGNANSAFRFDGVDDNIYVSETDHPTGEVTITYAAWIYLESGRTKNGAVIDVGDGRGRDVSNKRSSILISYDDKCIGYIGEYNDIKPTSACVTENEWNFIVITKDGRNVKFYVNGKLRDSGTHGSGQNLSNTQMNIGLAKDYSSDSGYEPFLGSIDDIRIYNRALTGSEIQQLYDVPLSPCENIDTDRDGVIDQLDDCPNTPPNSLVYSNGCDSGVIGCSTLDIDGDGRVDALSDTLLAMRYAFGFRGQSLIAGAVSPDCTRCTVEAIETYLETLQ